MQNLTRNMSLLVVLLMIGGSMTAIAAQEDEHILSVTDTDLDITDTFEGNNIEIEKMDGFPFEGMDLRSADYGSNPGMIFPTSWYNNGPTPRSDVPSWGNDDPSNDDPDNADTLIHGQSVLDQHVDGSGTTAPTDQDWYRVYLDGYNSPQAQSLNITVNRTSVGVIVARILDPWLGASFLDVEYVGQPVWENISYLDIDAHISGYYLIQILAANATEVNYNLENVTISNAPAGDGDNVMWTSPATSSPPTGKKVTQSFDHWDFYNLSGMVTNNPSTGKEFMNFTVAVNVPAQTTVTEPDLIGTPMQVFAWTGLTFFWRDANTGTLEFRGGMEEFPDNGGSVGVSVGGANTIPINFWGKTNGYQVYIGINTFAFNIINQQLVYSESDAWADYDFTSLTVTEEYINDVPVLSEFSVEPPTGTKHDSYTFSVKYSDADNNPWTNISMILNAGSASAKTYGLTPEGTIDYLNGTVCTVTIDGTSMIDGANSFKFKATDIRDATIFYPVTGGHAGPIVAFNDPTELKPGAPATLTLTEDQNDVTMNFTDFFTDPDIGDIPHIRIFDNSQDSWVSDKVYFGNFSVEIGDDVDGPPKDRPFTIELKQNAFGTEVVKLSGSDKSNPSADDYVTHMLTIDIGSVNDGPKITSVAQKTVFQNEVGISAIEDQWKNFTLIFVDVDSPNPRFSTDILEVFPDLVLGSSYFFDSQTGEINFLPDNEMVGESVITITINDQDSTNPLEHTVNVTVVITNTNDAPVWEDGPDDQSVKQNEWINITLSDFVNDPDWGKIDRDDVDMEIYMGQLEFRSDIEDEIPGVRDFDDLIEIDDKKDKYDVLFALKTGNAMVGEYDVEFEVRDEEGAKAEITIEFEIENVNDPPTWGSDHGVFKVSSAGTTDEHFTNTDVEFKVDLCSDPDMNPSIDPFEEIVYTWDFNDGSIAQSGTDLTMVTHQFDLEDNYNVTLTVSDGEATIESISLVEVKLNRELDVDDDGLKDWWEMEYFLTLDYGPLDDFDQDGASNLDEHNIKSDPTDPNSYPPSASGTPTDDKGDEDSSFWLWIILIVVIVVVVLVIVLFMIISTKKKIAMASQPMAFPPSGLPPGGPAEYAPLPTEEGAPETAAMAPGADFTSALGETAPPSDMYASPFVDAGDAEALPAQGEAAQAKIAAPEEVPALPPAPEGAVDTQAEPGAPAEPAAPTEPAAPETSAEPTPPAESIAPPTEPAETPTGPTIAEGAAAQAPAGNTCPSCGTAIQPGWFLCPGCKNPLS